MYRLQCKAQNYAWGKIGHDSLVAQLLAANPSTIPSTPIMDPNRPYAELWMGTHPSAPSMVILEEREKESGNSSFSVLPLKNFITPHNLGKDHAATFGASHNDLPYLFKVLSIEKALSIQAHPDKLLAEKLHREDPAHYPDDNHKPELVVALSPFQALCCFRKVQEVVMFLETVPELAEQTGWTSSSSSSEKEEEAISDMLKQKAKELLSGSNEESINDNNNHVASAFFKPLLSKLYAAPKEKTAALQQKFMIRLAKEVSSSSSQNHQEDESSSQHFRKTSLRAIDAFKQIYSQFPDDVGCWMVFVLNVVDMQPGDGLFLAANEPHAYLAGDCVEIMAASDNVIRAGLTPKFKDVNTLLESLTYKTNSLEEAAFKYNPNCHLQSYVPPSFIPEFRLERVTVFKSSSSSKDQNDENSNNNRVRIPIDSAAIFLTLNAEEGKCKCTCIFEEDDNEENENGKGSKKSIISGDNEMKVTSIKRGDVRAVLLENNNNNNNNSNENSNNNNKNAHHHQQRYLEFQNLSATTDLVCFVAQARGDGNPMATPKISGMSGGGNGGGSVAASGSWSKM